MFTQQAWKVPLRKLGGGRAATHPACPGLACCLQKSSLQIQSFCAQTLTLRFVSRGVRGVNCGVVFLRLLLSSPLWDFKQFSPCPAKMESSVVISVNLVDSTNWGHEPRFSQEDPHSPTLTPDHHVELVEEEAAVLCCVVIYGSECHLTFLLTFWSVSLGF